MKTGNGNGILINKIMKPFDLEEAKQGKPVCNKAGANVRILCFDRKGEDYPIVALHDNQDGEEFVCFHTSNGRNYKSAESELDLSMKAEKKEGWINVLINASYFGSKTAGTIYPTKEEALKDIDTKSPHYIDTVKIEWEE